MSTLKTTIYHFVVLWFMGLTLFACSSKSAEDQTSSEKDDVNDSTQTNKMPVTKKQTILFFGNSLTAGYGLDPTEAFSSLIQKKIDSLKLPYTVINAGLSGETSAGGKARISWVLRQPVDIFVLELGANDGLRGIELSDTRKNLQAIIDTVKARNPDTKLVLAGMQMPPNLGKKYITEFKELYPKLAEANQAVLIPFLLDKVAGIPSLNQADGIHPTAEGNKIVAENVWAVLQPLLTQPSL
ncbi:arylesterase [Xanthocytophaga flava]|uniref:arylesterase n=1 Tax=Xanthocytophaga flava TaxID=3048013 RepID=UPI0028D7C04E|nr:arylesterase [Xanthocytophaga flavus]